MKYKFTILLILLMVIMIPTSLGYTSTIPAWQGNVSEIYENNGMHYFIPLNITDNIYQNIPIYTTFYLNNVTLVNMQIIISTTNTTTNYVITNCTNLNIEIVNNDNSSTIFLSNSTNTTMVSLLYPVTTLTIIPSVNTPMSSEAIFQSWSLLYWSSNTQYIMNMNDLTSVVMITVLFLIAIMIVVMLVAIVRGSKL
ncbi:MAG: hypothetical protein QXR39_09345 [Candidatus Methanomethylicia archaeon]